MSRADRYGIRRLAETRPVRDVVTIVCDDTKTAVGYFEALEREVADRRAVRVFAAPRHGADATSVIKLAADKRPNPSETGDRLFALIDLDTNPDADGARREAASRQVTALLSNPCFEVWTLAHLQNTGEAFTDCEAVRQRVKVKWKEVIGRDFGRKSQAEYRQIVGMALGAIERCKRRDAASSQSWTEVWKAVEAILR